MSGLKNLGAKRPSQAVPAAPTATALGRLHVDIPADLLRQVRVRAAETDTDLRVLVIDALTSYLER